VAKAPEEDHNKRLAIYNTKKNNQASYYLLTAYLGFKMMSWFTNGNNCQALAPSNVLRSPWRFQMASLVVILVLCRPFTTNALFVQPSFQPKPYPSLTLATADRLGAPYKGIAYDAGKAASLPGFALTLDAEFGALDLKTFLILQNTYCVWSQTKSQVKWQQGREYSLLDFLPPLLQAVSGLHFKSSRAKQKGLPSFVGGPSDRVKKYAEQEVLLASNCWGFAWEVLFQADNADTCTMTVSTADPSSAWKAFTGPGFDLIQSSLTKPQLLKDKKLRNKKLQGGDVLLLWHTITSSNRPNKVYLDHVVTWIDDDVVFEKSGSGDKVPFRINTWEGLVANFPPFVFNWDWRRLVRNNRNSPSLWQPYLTLKPASEIFGVDSLVALANRKDRFSLLKELRTSVAKQISLTASLGVAEDGTQDEVVEAQIFTGILELEDLEFDPETGRASLPRSAFDTQIIKPPQLPENPYRKDKR
jgi:hypothetical protein